MDKTYQGLNGVCEIPSYTTSSVGLPTKYQAGVISNTAKKGFSSQTKRFCWQNSLNENPGPGTYGSIATAEVISPSFSVIGTGSFASKAFRFPRNPQRGRPTPGPNAYNLQSSLIKYSLSRGASRAFRSPVALQRDVLKDITPAPNQYDVHFTGPERNPIVAASSAFLSKTRRSYVSSPNTVNVPSPCHYEVKEAVIQKCPRVAMSPFKSKTPRLPPTQDSLVPGPGAYSPHQAPASVKRTIRPRRHYLTLSAPPLIVTKSPLLPGPGQYDLVNYDGPSKRLMSSAVFVSHTRRMIHEKRGQGGPGPGFYEPQTPSTRSFLYNHSKIWIPT